MALAEVIKVINRVPLNLHIAYEHLALCSIIFAQSRRESAPI